MRRASGGWRRLTRGGCLLDLAALLRLGGGDLDPLLPNVEPQTAKEAHVDVGEPYEREACDQITAPVVEQQLVACDDQEEGGHIVAEAVLTREQVEELARDQGAT